MTNLGGAACTWPNTASLRQSRPYLVYQTHPKFDFIKVTKSAIWIDIEYVVNRIYLLSLQVYTVHFKCNKKLLREYPNLFNYTKDIFQIPGMSSTVHMAHIKQHYYGSHPSINPFGIIPIGSSIDYSSPHDRERFRS